MLWREGLATAVVAGCEERVEPHSGGTCGRSRSRVGKSEERGKVKSEGRVKSRGRVKSGEE